MCFFLANRDETRFVYSLHMWYEGQAYGCDFGFYYYKTQTRAMHGEKKLFTVVKNTISLLRTQIIKLKAND